ncbi:uncharacterized protein HME9302_01010 [Alteripontixanthobacter maritimus]|uniref:Bile acid:sodium symporter n=1 Tax=Alteripontixanthobacter maritimus TaxID=2161824 RepID=A0A369Q8E4_9SPHN|nr:bile acid:sodium symporter [Alteripontixanthobacter maritimus]RDC59815.1 uncharacterized protein HME9302_01010 [Alteripontixanthobacter maritimus]
MRMLARLFDPMVRLLLLAIAFAVILPATGDARVVAGWISDGAIFLLFLLNGLRLSRSDVAGGLRNLRVMLPLVAWCYGAMALAGLGLWHVTASVLPPMLALGFLFLGTLSSTVQSATAYTSMAGGNGATSVVAAALLNILGVFVTAPLFSVLGGGGAVTFGSEALIRIALILLLPFAIGQMFQVRMARWTAANRPLIGWMDRIAIGIAVYVAMSGAVAEGLGTRVDPAAWGWLGAGVAVFLLFGFGGAWTAGGALRLPRGDRIAFLFAGAQKSTAMGVPLASILFTPAMAGLVIVPLLAYHLLQLVVSAPIAQRLTRQALP